MLDICSFEALLGNDMLFIYLDEVMIRCKDSPHFMMGIKIEHNLLNPIRRRGLLRGTNFKRAVRDRFPISQRSNSDPTVYCV